MKKILFIIIFIASFNSTFADTGSSNVTRSSGSGTTECGTSTSHGLIHYGVPSNNKDNLFDFGNESCNTHTYYSGNEFTKNFTKGSGGAESTSCGNEGQTATGVIKGPPTDPSCDIDGSICYFTCQNWDDTAPTVGIDLKDEDNNDYTSGDWINEDITATVIFSDTGKNGSTTEGSGTGAIELREEDNDFLCDDTGNWYALETKDYDESKYVCFKVKDKAGNGFVYSSVAHIKIDKIAPDAGDISSSLIDGIYLPANNNENIVITGTGAGGSPIVLIEGEFEDYNNHTQFISLSSATDLLTYDANISKVDGTDRTLNNYRPYTYNITNICDEAGNCTTDPIEFIYNVYAGDVDSLSSLECNNNLVKTCKEILEDSIADGNEKTIKISPIDEYGNKIIPVKESDGITSLRDLNFILNYDNSLYLDQYKQSGNSGIEFTDFDGSTYSDANILPNQDLSTIISDVSNDDGDYILKYKVYSPTYDSGSTDGSQYVNGEFRINSLNINGFSISNLGNIDTKFKPLYYTDLDIADSGFVIGSTQTGTLNIEKNGSQTQSKEVFLEFGVQGTPSSDPGYHVLHPQLEMNYDDNASLDWNSVGSGYDNLTYFGNNSSDIYTKIVQSGALDVSEINTYFATHIKIDFGGGKEVVYSSDTHGMDRYNGNFNGIEIAEQLGILVQGLTHSEDSQELVTGDDGDSFTVIGDLDKSILQKDIRKRAYSLIRKVVTTPTSQDVDDLDFTNDEAGEELDNGNMLYFGGLAGSKVDVKLGSSYEYNGIKTLLVEGGDVFIQSNILADEENEDILGIIVLKDENDKGGNIYIDPSVQKIDAVIYADKVIASSDSSYVTESVEEDRILSPNNGGTATKLKNQLYIYGSIFSSNTIGGSVDLSDLKCPYYITEACDLDTAQKYDMNYIRRGIENKYNGLYEDYPFIIKYNPSVQLTPPPLFGE